LERQALRTATCAGPAAWPASGSAAVRRSCGWSRMVRRAARSRRAT